MGQHERRESLDPELAQAPVDPCFRRSLIDEQSTRRNLEEHGVALPDVEHSDAEAVRGNPGGRTPTGHPGGEDDGADTRERERHPPPAMAGESTQRDHQHGGEADRDDDARRMHLGVWEPGEQVGAPGDPRCRLTREPRERRGCTGQHGIEDRAD